ncbi:MAG: hypothetical protein NZT61_00820 [Deltaproteobacteria bacterium]|nr:hypothetical protein [Deltaproteobacteria bacterium]MCX7952879.1 hypothetical protein [Deltaproteobacteria bacterium]
MSFQQLNTVEPTIGRVILSHHGSVPPLAFEILPNKQPQAGKGLLNARRKTLSGDPIPNGKYSNVNYFRGWALLKSQLRRKARIFVPKFLLPNIGSQILTYPEFVEKSLGIRFEYVPPSDWNKKISNYFRKPVSSALVRLNSSRKPYGPCEQWLPENARDTYRQLHSKEGFTRFMIENGFADLIPETRIVELREARKALKEMLKNGPVVVQRSISSGGVGTFVVKKDNGNLVVFPRTVIRNKKGWNESVKSVGKALQTLLGSRSGKLILRPFIGTFEDIPLVDCSFSFSFWLTRRRNGDIQVHLIPSRTQICKSSLFSYRGFIANDTYLQELLSKPLFLDFLVSLARRLIDIPFPFIYSIDGVVDKEGNLYLLELNLRDSATSAPVVLLNRILKELPEDIAPLIDPYCPGRIFSLAQYDFYYISLGSKDCNAPDFLSDCNDRLLKNVSKKLKEFTGEDFIVRMLSISQLKSDLSGFNSETTRNHVYVFPMTPYFFHQKTSIDRQTGEEKIFKRAYLNLMFLFPKGHEETMRSFFESIKS